MGACLGTQGAVGTGLDFEIDAAKRQVGRFESGPTVYYASVHYECGKDLLVASTRCHCQQSFKHLVRDNQVVMMQFEDWMKQTNF